MWGPSWLLPDIDFLFLKVLFFIFRSWIMISPWKQSVNLITKGCLVRLTKAYSKMSELSAQYDIDKDSEEINPKLFLLSMRRLHKFVLVFSRKWYGKNCLWPRLFISIAPGVVKNMMIQRFLEVWLILCEKWKRKQVFNWTESNQWRSCLRCVCMVWVWGREYYIPAEPKKYSQ